jgi:hypothetical protein
MTDVLDSCCHIIIIIIIIIIITASTHEGLSSVGQVGRGQKLYICSIITN